jgi:hypothetical protein
MGAYLAAKADIVPTASIAVGPRQGLRACGHGCLAGGNAMRRPRSVSRGWRILLAGFLAFAALGASQPLGAKNDRVTVPLREYENSGVSGTATLKQTDEGLHVSMTLTGEPLSGNHPAHIHTGTCADFDPDPIYPLTTVILDDVSKTGMSNSTVEDVELDDLLRDDYVILVHESPDELTNYLVCADIKMSASINGVAKAGVGSLDFHASAALLGALAVVAGAASVALRLSWSSFR